MVRSEDVKDVKKMQIKFLTKVGRERNVLNPLKGVYENLQVT